MPTPFTWVGGGGARPQVQGSNDIASAIIGAAIRQQLETQSPRWAMMQQQMQQQQQQFGQQMGMRQAELAQRQSEAADRFTQRMKEIDLQTKQLEMMLGAEGRAVEAHEMTMRGEELKRLEAALELATAEGVNDQMVEGIASLLERSPNLEKVAKGFRSEGTMALFSAIRERNAKREESAFQAAQRLREAQIEESGARTEELRTQAAVNRANAEPKPAKSLRDRTQNLYETTYVDALNRALTDLPEEHPDWTSAQIEAEARRLAGERAARAAISLGRHLSGEITPEFALEDLQVMIQPQILLSLSADELVERYGDSIRMVVRTKPTELAKIDEAIAKDTSELSGLVARAYFAVRDKVGATAVRMQDIKQPKSKLPWWYTQTKDESVPVFPLLEREKIPKAKKKGNWAGMLPEG